VQSKVPEVEDKVKDLPVESSEGESEEESEEDDDGEGEWITPSNVAAHKSRALHLVPDSAGAATKGPQPQIKAACMTADFAMQNVLLQMGLDLIDVEGRRISTVKSWVLRCHACFK
jgi:RNA-binding protein NOB1